jgi:molybdopterin adenylyltransferase
VNAAVLTVSDSAHAGTRDDVSGPTVRASLEKAGWSVVSGVVPDDIEEIASKLQSWVRSGEIDAIFTTGGTGVASRDVTPEATRRVIDREIPGLSEWMRSEGMKKTPLAILSRGIAGTCGKCVILNLPGSPKGARESIESVLNVIPHIIDLLKGKTEHRNSQ